MSYVHGEASGLDIAHTRNHPLLIFHHTAMKSIYDPGHGVVGTYTANMIQSLARIIVNS